MDASHSVRNAIANIQDELSRISTLSELFDLEPSRDLKSFQNKIVAEFNTKLRGFKTKNRRLAEENAQLRARIRQLENEINTSRVSVRLEGPKPSMAPPRKRTLEEDEEKVEILSSPVKGARAATAAQHGSDSAGARNRSPSQNITSSQFDKLPTQYSDTSSQAQESAKTGGGKPEGSWRPASISMPEDEYGGSFDGVVADSQDELEPLSPSKHAKSYPKHYTALQRVEFLRQYYQIQFAEKSFTISLAKNPITEQAWAADDFVPNEDYRPPKKLNPNLAVMTKAQEQSYHEFFKQSGVGQKAAGPVWDSDELADDDVDPGFVRSQVMDKYSSPPGYMTGDFASTQEAEEKRRRRICRQEERMQRRLCSALNGGEFLFYEGILNDFVKQRRFTR